jgi:hypothetical protein
VAVRADATVERRVASLVAPRGDALARMLPVGTFRPDESAAPIERS